MSAIEEQFAEQLTAAELDEPWIREHRFAPPRRWRFDFAWPEQRIALEIDGGLYVYGAHNRGAAIEAAYEKRNVAETYGWRVLTVSAHQVKDGRALLWVRQLMASNAHSTKPLVF